MTKALRERVARMAGVASAVASLLILIAAAPDPFAPMTLDTFDDLTPWRVAASDGVSATKAPVPGEKGGALRLAFDLGPSAGYAFAHRDLPLDLPENFEITFVVRGETAPNNLEFKLTDASGDNVWWHVRRDFQVHREWREVRIKKRQISFAWGPTADKTLRRAASIEVVVSAGSGGGAGWIEIDQLMLRRLPVETGEPPPIAARATSANALAPLSVDGDLATAWRSPASPRGPQALTLDLGRMREFGGLSLTWAPGAHARDYDIELSDDGLRWRLLRRVRGGDGGEDPILATESEARFIRIRMENPGGQGLGLADIRVEPLPFGADANAFLMELARRAPRGLHPRGFAGEQSYWTLVGVKGGGDGALLSEDGALELGRGGPSVEPFVIDAAGITTWADVEIAHRLADHALPVPSVEWTHPAWKLTVNAFVAGERGNDRLVGRYTLRNLTHAPLSLRLALVVRPLQVNPPTQFLTTPGGVSPIRSMAWDGEVMSVGARRIFPLARPDMAGVSTFDSGAYPQRLMRADAAGERAVEDETGLASGVLAYDVVLPPLGERRLGIVAPLTGGTPALPHTEPDRWLDEEDARVAAFWRKELSTTRVDAAGEGRAVTNALRTSLAHILIMQDGPILRPGARSYARSWIRDGAMIAEALLRLGHEEEAKAYLRWYATHLFPNGKVPCCVDARGADPVPENDSHGEFIHLAAEVWRYTGDRALLQSVWPKVEAAARYMNQQRLSERVPSHLATPERRNLFGLMPPSISHEGYSAKPAYSYWDDFWTLRGFEDAVMLAATFGDAQTRASLAAQRDEFRTDLMTSLRMTARRFDIPYIAGAADLGDFDATSTTIALSPGGLRRQLPADLLEGTFERYWQNFTARRDGAAAWKDYTPYEWRVVGAFVRLGHRERARQALDFFMGDRRPLAWNQWAEVVGRVPREPRFIGDMPHGWVASDFIRSALDLFVYERREDDALVIAAGVPENWLREDGVRIQNYRTPWGPLSFTMQAEGDRLTVRLQGKARPPGGFIIPADLFGPSDALVDGRRVKWSGAELKVVRASATIVLIRRKEGR
ncbi:discoidin domain-containing protein [Hyalangium rubrum]|uniref:Discoidin domain-containing protein n=1 Tax=Hyalangium rubrum TaxID=3103134 RepID=A0ABU5H9N7_9BACT|nr:discoidin domain-containing protein [Hyalangium sp. s54d21]MDY7228820.1 discoidin domain-containing protein [Hyalangium sp. s54d21]